MALPKTLAPFRDIEAVLDTILRLDEWPAEFTCNTHKQALHWRARANQFRAVIRRMEEERLNLERGVGTSIYDELKFVIDHERSTVVTIEKRLNSGKLSVGGEAVEPVSDRELYPFVEQEETGDVSKDPFES